MTAVMSYVICYVMSCRVCVWLSVRRGDVLSAWSGIRPLVTNPNSKDTQSLARNHIIEVSDNNLITIAGRSVLCNTGSIPGQ